jgi:hypothetical protein
MWTAFIRAVMHATPPPKELTPPPLHDFSRHPPRHPAFLHGVARRRTARRALRRRRATLAAKLEAEAEERRRTLASRPPKVRRVRVKKVDGAKEVPAAVAPTGRAKGGR